MLQSNLANILIVIGYHHNLVAVLKPSKFSSLLCFVTKNKEANLINVGKANVYFVCFLVFLREEETFKQSFISSFILPRKFEACLFRENIYIFYLFCAQYDGFYIDEDKTELFSMKS